MLKIIALLGLTLAVANAYKLAEADPKTEISQADLPPELAQSDVQPEVAHQFRFRRPKIRIPVRIPIPRIPPIILSLRSRIGTNALGDKELASALSNLDTAPELTLDDPIPALFKVDLPSELAQADIASNQDPANAEPGIFENNVVPAETREASAPEAVQQFFRFPSARKIFKPFRKLVKNIGKITKPADIAKVVVPILLKTRELDDEELSALSNMEAAEP